MMKFSDSDSATAWSEGAVAWDTFVESGADYYRREVHGPALLDACGPLRDQRVLDVGCGQGYFSRQLAAGGAKVITIDVASKLLALAEAHETQERLGIDYRTLDAAAIAEHLSFDSFDLVAGCMSLQDIADVGGALRGAFAVLRPGGRMVFSVPHPATDMPFREWARDEAGRKRHLKLDRYFETGQDLCHWNMSRLVYHWSTPCWRHTLSEWTTLVTVAGFVIGGLCEPRPTPDQVAANPHLDDCRRMPFFLVFDLWKPSKVTAASRA